MHKVLPCVIKASSDTVRSIVQTHRLSANLLSSSSMSGCHFCSHMMKSILSGAELCAD